MCLALCECCCLFEAWLCWYSGRQGPTHDVDAVVPNQTIVDNLFKRSEEEFGGCSKEDIAQALKETNNNKSGSAATLLRKKFA